MGTSSWRAAATAALGGILAATAAGQEVLHTLGGGGAAGKGLGQILRPAGDVDRDGFADLIAGYRQGSTAGGVGAGTAQVFSGRTGAVLHTFVGSAPAEGLGRAVDGAGDLDGDGWDDLVLGAPGADAQGLDSGLVRVHSGRDGALLFSVPGPFARARFGHAVAGLGDVNGDGHGDLAVSAQPDPGTPQPAGFVRILSGLDGSVLRELVGPALTSRLGCSIADAGDVDGDGVRDLVAGDWRDHTTAVGAGAVRVYSGASGAMLHEFLGDLAQDHLGRHVDGAGDVDGDGFADLIAGSPFANGALNDVGLARVWSGRDGALLYSLHGDFPLDFFGAAVAGAGDVDGDGRDDFLVGAFADDDGATNAGSARVYSGADGSVLMRLDGDSAGDELGFAVARVGDADGDGGQDFAVSAPMDDAGGGPMSGSVRVYRGIPPPSVGPQSYCITSANGVGPGALMGWAGSTSVAADDLLLTATGAVPRSIGLFFVGAQQTQAPLFGGVLCVAPPLQRLPPAVRIGRDGSTSLRLGHSRRRGCRPLITPGSTWNFQLLYVDRGRRGRAGLNLSDGLCVTFTP